MTSRRTERLATGLTGTALVTGGVLAREHAVARATQTATKPVPTVLRHSLPKDWHVLSASKKVKGLYGLGALGVVAGAPAIARAVTGHVPARHREETAKRLSTSPHNPILAGLQGEKDALHDRFDPSKHRSTGQSFRANALGLAGAGGGWAAGKFAAKGAYKLRNAQRAGIGLAPSKLGKPAEVVAGIAGAALAGAAVRGAIHSRQDYKNVRDGVKRPRRKPVPASSKAANYEGRSRYGGDQQRFRHDTVHKNDPGGSDLHVVVALKPIKKKVRKFDKPRPRLLPGMNAEQSAIQIRDKRAKNRLDNVAEAVTVGGLIGSGALSQAPKQKILKPLRPIAHHAGKVALGAAAVDFGLGIARQVKSNRINHRDLEAQIRLGDKQGIKKGLSVPYFAPKDDGTQPLANAVVGIWQDVEKRAKKVHYVDEFGDTPCHSDRRHHTAIDGTRKADVSKVTCEQCLGHVQHNVVTKNALSATAGFASRHRVAIALPTGISGAAGATGLAAGDNDKAKEAAAAAVGGQAAFRGVGYGAVKTSNLQMKRAKEAGTWTRSQNNKAQSEARHAAGLNGMPKAQTEDHFKMLRNVPKRVPGSLGTKIGAHMAGRRGLAMNIAATTLPAAAVLLHHKKSVEKNLVDEAARAAKKAAKAARPRLTDEEIAARRAAAGPRIEAPKVEKPKGDPNAQVNLKRAKSPFLSRKQYQDAAWQLPLAATGITLGMHKPQQKPVVKWDNGDSARTAAGAVGGASLLDQADVLSGAYLKHKGRKIREKSPYTDEHKATLRAHQVEHGLVDSRGRGRAPMASDSHAVKNKMFRSFPKSLPDARVQRLNALRDKKTPFVLAAGALGGGLLAARHQHKGNVVKAAPLKTSISDDDADKLVARHGLTGPLPKHLDRPQRMAAYEARYKRAGGHKAQKWDHRASIGDKIKTGGLVGATVGSAVWTASRLKGGKVMPHALHARLSHPKVVRAAETAVGASATAGGAGELYAAHARRKRSSYASQPAGVAASALRRMQAYPSN